VEEGAVEKARSRNIKKDLKLQEPRNQSTKRGEKRGGKVSWRDLPGEKDGGFCKDHRRTETKGKEKTGM